MAGSHERAASPASPEAPSSYRLEADDPRTDSSPKRVAGASPTPHRNAKALTGLAERTTDRIAHPSGANEASRATTTRELTTILTLVDELASLAADLWFAGKLEHFAFEPEPDDDD